MLSHLILTFANNLSKSELISLIAVLASTYAVVHDRFFYRGSRVRLANQDDEQHSSVDRWSEDAPWIRELFPAYPAGTFTTVVRLVWVNGGGRPSYVFVRNITVTAMSGATYPRAFYSYQPVAAGEAALQPILIRGLPEHEEVHVILAVEYSWWRTRWWWRSRMVPDRGEVKARILPRPPI